MSNKYVVKTHISETSLRNKYPSNELRDLNGFDYFSFPSVGTVCETNTRGSSILYNGFTVCDVYSKMTELCFQPVMG